MKNSLRKTAILILFSLLFAFSAFAQNTKSKNSIEGVWNVSFSSPKFQLPALMEFVEKDSKIYGYAATFENVEINISDVALEGDSLKIDGNAVFNQTKVPINITAEISDNTLAGKFKIPFFGEVAMKGARLPAEFSSLSREKIFDQVSALVEKKFYAPDYNGLDWNSEKKIYREKIAAANSYPEMILLIREMLNKLKASHVGFYPNLPSLNTDKESSGEKNVEWKKINEKTGYIKVKEFADDTKQSEILINQAFSELNRLPFLIVDLRDNPGGGIEVALPLARHIFAGKQCVGYFYDRTAATKLKTDSLEELKHQNFPVYSSEILPEKSHGSKLVINGLGDKSYKGKVVILINETDYSTTEAFAAAFKESGRGILIGAKTGGKMLAMETFTVGKFWILQLPTADFRTCNGIEVEKRGVKPDIEVSDDNSEDTALARALSFLNQ